MDNKKDTNTQGGKALPNLDTTPPGIEEMVISYLLLRKTIGLLGFALPFLVSFGALGFFQTSLQNSVSSYYYTPMRDAFVGTLWAIGIFLFAYRGYGPIDDLATNAAGVFAVGISLFPTAPAGPTISAVQSAIGLVHVVFALLFFLTLSGISLFLFTRTETDPNKERSSRKPKRDMVYKVCGVAMLFCIGLSALYLYIPSIHAMLPSARYHPIFFLETAADVAFGVAWAVKGHMLFKDDEKFLKKRGGGITEPLLTNNI